MRTSVAGVLCVITLGAIAAPGAPGVAAAQSRRYPPAPVDKDAERAARSDLWNAAITPQRHPYDELVHAAIAALGQRTADQRLEAIKKLDAAIQLLPRDPEAYRLRGDAHLEDKQWAQCAADFAVAEARTPQADEPPRALAELRRKLGLCQARAGKLADAEKTLAETVASGNGTGEVWMRLGEVRIAMGKLDEAIAALRAAADSAEPAAPAMIHFLLAVAYDRARRPADALVEAAAGVKLDPQLTTLQNPVVPPLGSAELDYMLGLAYSADPPRLEHALAHFRRFEAAAPDSPWRKRADEHIHDVKAIELPDTITRNGSAPIDLDAARAAVRRAMPQLRPCLARLPPIVVEVEITRAGPRTPPTDGVRPRLFTPPDGITVRRSAGALGDLSDRELDAVDRCLQPVVARIALPAVKERDTYYKITFHVVAP